MLPPVTALALYFINPDYISQLWLTPKGRMMSMIALAFPGAGDTHHPQDRQDQGIRKNHGF